MQRQIQRKQSKKVKTYPHTSKVQSYNTALGSIQSKATSLKTTSGKISKVITALKKVSELFFTTKSNGTGLGLAYSKEVIELHNGIFKIESVENEGTTITITIPKEKKSEDFNNKNY